jgi:hypothetical protein
VSNVVQTISASCDIAPRLGEVAGDAGREAVLVHAMPKHVERFRGGPRR